ncbi:uncharacterized protein LOC143858600 isoform X2 [Tasmannia lanceolata]|uniref:uncharacterized protein LOC143847551 isoform X2 n=1 Tax=Tasmannia lanceolata TaxID=3420 RepID=UPI004063213D
MPGAIQVSVLDLMPSPSSSLVSVKVAMGKREYQTWDQGEFLFPLTTLRDNLIVTLCDAEGNEISRTDVQTMSVVEKGSWDDSFPLEGGVQVRMKLQFILNEEERKRIMEVRDSVVKKKQGELIKRTHSHTSLENAKDAAAEECSEGSISIPVHQGKELSSSPIQREGTMHDQSEQVTPDGSGNLSMAPLSLELQEHPEQSSEYEVHLTEENYISSEEKLKTQLPPTDVPQEALDHQIGCSESILTEVVNENNISFSATLVENTENSNPFSATLGEDIENRNSFYGRLGQDRACSSETKIFPGTSPTNVRKMISAFESGITQGKIPHIIPITKSQLGKIDMEGYLKGQYVEQDETEKTKATQQAGRTGDNSFSVGSPARENSQGNLENFQLLYVKRTQETQHSSLDTSWKSMGKDKQLLGFENNQNLKKLNLGNHKPIKTESLDAAESQLPERNNDLEPIEGSIGKFNEKKEYGTIDPVGLDVQSAYQTSEGEPPSQESEQLELEGLGAIDNPVDESSSTKNRTDQDHEIHKCVYVPFSLTFGPVGLDSQTAYGTSEGALSSQESEQLEEVGPMHYPDDESNSTEKSKDQENEVHKSVDTKCKSSVNEVLDGREFRTCREDLERLNIHASSNKKLEPLKYCKVDRCSFERLGRWIFQDDARHLCITTSSKQVRNLVEGCNIFTDTHLSERALSHGEESKMCDDIHDDVYKDDESSYNLRNSKVESSIGVPGKAGGLIEQVIRVVVIVACGTLFLSNRPRNNR